MNRKVLDRKAKPQRQLFSSLLFWKYVALFVGAIGLALVTDSMINIWFTTREHRADLVRFQKEQASAAAARISQFIRAIEGQLGWTTQLSWASPLLEQRELDGLRLMRQVPAITELSLLDDHGREQVRLSRQAMDRRGSNADFSATESFRVAASSGVYYGPVQFRRETEPYMTLAVAGARRDAGVSIAEVNLKLIWDVVSKIRVGKTGRAYVVDDRGRLIAHPDLSLVLRNTDLSRLAQVRAAWAGPSAGALPRVVADMNGEPVLTEFARADPLNWFVFVELPETEADLPIFAAIHRSILVLVAGLLLALLAALIMARRMVQPIRDLTVSAARIGAGALDHRIAISTGDEFGALGTQFNRMATQLQGSYLTLERKVEERTHQLQVANQSKSRFLAAASHDLRQPLHALNLFAAQLLAETDPAERDRLAVQIDAAVANMNDLFNALLDISRLDAGVLHANMVEFPVNTVLDRLDAMFTGAARAKALRLRVVRSRSWIRSDPILLERLLLNLVANAVRYTAAGGIVVGCRRVDARLRIEVCDTGIGIPAEHQAHVFDEFYRVTSPEQDRKDGLGLGLAIVARLGALLDHPVSVTSTPGRGSRFGVSVLSVPARADAPIQTVAGTLMRDPLQGKRVVVIDDDPLVLDGTGGLLRSWGCRVVVGASATAILANLDGDIPDLIMSDFHLRDGRTGIDAIAALREACHGLIPAFLISGDISRERLHEAQARGYHLLHKPLSPIALRAMLSRLLHADTRA